VIEHFGLGRFGDEIDPWGYKLGFKHASDLLKPGGVFYFSVPMEPQRVEFNAHRVFELRYLLNMIGEHGFDIADFSFVNDGLSYRKCAISRRGDHVELLCKSGMRSFRSS
jgi:hypothetical protein